MSGLAETISGVPFREHAPIPRVPVGEKGVVFKFHGFIRTWLCTQARGLGIAVAALASLVIGGVAVPAQDLRSDAAPLAAEASVPKTLQNSGVDSSFELIDHNGEIVTDAAFRGRYMLIYFGYSFCPDICPTALARMTQAIDLLEEDGAIVTPIFITVDPERDTPEVLKSYVTFFHPRLVGLTGSAEQVNKVAKAYRVFHMRIPVSGEYEPYYTVDHSSVTYMLGPDGRIATRFWDNLSPESMAERVLTIMRVRAAKKMAPTSTAAEGF